jgi:hypothetical protein
LHYEKCEKLLKEYPQTFQSYINMYECTWQHYRQNSTKVQDFFAQNPILRPLERLNPRSAIKGALVQAYSLQAHSKMGKFLPMT